VSLSAETIRLKVRNKIFIPLTFRSRGKKLRCKSFTIISNNCWAGTVYESYGLKKQSPTVGMFIMPDDYIKLARNFEHYMKQTPKIIPLEMSKWKSELEHKDNWGTYPVARLDDIELHLLHYHDEEMFMEKWKRRVERIDKKRIIFKFNDQNGCREKHIKEFMSLPIKNKLCFVSKKELKISDDVLLIKQPERYKDGIKASREPFGRTKYIDMTSYLNSLEENTDE